MEPQDTCARCRSKGNHFPQNNRKRLVGNDIRYGLPAICSRGVALTNVHSIRARANRTMERTGSGLTLTGVCSLVLSAIGGAGASTFFLLMSLFFPKPSTYS